MLKNLLLGSVVMAVAGIPVLAQAQAPAREFDAVENFVPLTDEILQNPDPSNWQMYRQNYEMYGYSPLDQINVDNVGQLALVWARVMEPGINESTAIVYNGVMYLGNSQDVIQAIEADTGELIWEYRRSLPTVEDLRSRWGERKRSVFLYGDKVYVVSWDNFVYALDAVTGQLVWETDRGGDYYVSNSNGPIVVNGVVIAGSTCQVAPFGCYVTGHDAENGEELWRNEFIPRPGEPGDETWADSPFENRWITGAWGQIVYDPELDMVYYGSTGVGPASEAARAMPGATLAGTNTRFAVRPDSGEVVWQHQVLPRDNWDQECTYEMFVMDTPVHPNPDATGMLAVNPAATSDMRRTHTGIPCKTGVLWSFDAATGEFLFAKSTVQQNLIDTVDADTGLVTVNEEVVLKEVGVGYAICPTYMGGRDWPSGAYNPETNVMFFQLQNLCYSSSTSRTDRDPAPQFAYNTTNVYIIAPGTENVGRIDAISAETGDTVWSWETRVSNYSPVTATAGGLLFNGGMDRWFRALDQETGEVVWQVRLASQAFGNATTYAVDGRQYVAMVAGGGFNAGALGLTPEADGPSGGNAVYVFALPDL